MLQIGQWPMNIKTLTCDEYDGTNTPDHSIDLKSYFTSVQEATTYGSFQFPTKAETPFNGNSFMKFEMDINSVFVRSGEFISNDISRKQLKVLGTMKTFRCFGKYEKLGQLGSGNGVTG